MENQEEGKVIGNFRAGAINFLSVIIIASLPLVFEKDKKDLLEHLRIVSPIFAGGLSYVLSIFFALFVNYVDVSRYKSQINWLEQEQKTLDPATDGERLTEIIADKAKFLRKISNINSKSLFV